MCGAGLGLAFTHCTHSRRLVNPRRHDSSQCFPPGHTPQPDRTCLQLGGSWSPQLPLQLPPDAAVVASCDRPTLLWTGERTRERQGLEGQRGWLEKTKKGGVKQAPGSKTRLLQTYELRAGPEGNTAQLRRFVAHAIIRYCTAETACITEETVYFNFQKGTNKAKVAKDVMRGNRNTIRQARSVNWAALYVPI